MRSVKVHDPVGLVVPVWTDDPVRVGPASLPKGCQSCETVVPAVALSSLTEPSRVSGAGASTTRSSVALRWTVPSSTVTWQG